MIRRVISRSFAAMRHDLAFTALVSLTLTGGGVFLGASKVHSAVSATATSLDCADHAMAIYNTRQAEPLRRAYECLPDEMNGANEGIDEPTWIQLMGDRPLHQTTTRRVAEYQAEGDRIVFYVADDGGRTVAFLIHLGDDGKVLAID